MPFSRLIGASTGPQEAATCTGNTYANETAKQPLIVVKSRPRAIWWAGGTGSATGIAYPCILLLFSITPVGDSRVTTNNLGAVWANPKTSKGFGNQSKEVLAGSVRCSGKSVQSINIRLLGCWW